MPPFLNDINKRLFQWEERFVVSSCMEELPEMAPSCAVISCGEAALKFSASGSLLLAKSSKFSLTIVSIKFPNNGHESAIAANTVSIFFLIIIAVFDFYAIRLRAE